MSNASPYGGDQSTSQGGPSPRRDRYDINDEELRADPKNLAIAAVLFLLAIVNIVLSPYELPVSDSSFTNEASIFIKTFLSDGKFYLLLPGLFFLLLGLPRKRR